MAIENQDLLLVHDISDGQSKKITYENLKKGGTSGEFGYWNRTGTTLSPVNDGDSVDLTRPAGQNSEALSIGEGGTTFFRVKSQGQVQLGGSNVATSPNIQLNQDGSAAFASVITAGDTIQSTSAVNCFVGRDANNSNTLTSKIEADGSATFAGNVTCFGGFNSNNLSVEGTAAAGAGLFIVKPGTVTDYAAKILNDGTASFTGKVTSASTEASDPGTALATKDYVDNAVGSIAGEVGTIAMLTTTRFNTAPRGIDWTIGEVMTNLSATDMIYSNTSGSAVSEIVYAPAGSSWMCLGYSNPSSAGAETTLWKRVA